MTLTRRWNFSGNWTGAGILHVKYEYDIKIKNYCVP
jgi:hypothetical protein